MFKIVRIYVLFYDFTTSTGIKTIMLYMKQIQYTTVPAIQTNHYDEHPSVYPFLWPQEWPKH